MGEEEEKEKKRKREKDIKSKKKALSTQAGYSIEKRWSTQGG